MYVHAKSALTLARFYLLACSFLVGISYGLLIRAPVEPTTKAAVAAMFGCIILSIDVLILYVGATQIRMTANQAAPNFGSNEGGEQLALRGGSELTGPAVPVELSGDTMILAVGRLLRSDSVIIGDGAPYVGVIFVKCIFSLFIAAVTYCFA